MINSSILTNYITNIQKESKVFVYDIPQQIEDMKYDMINIIIYHKQRDMNKFYENFYTIYSGICFKYFTDCTQNIKAKIIDKLKNIINSNNERHIKNFDDLKLITNSSQNSFKTDEKIKKNKSLFEIEMNDMMEDIFKQIVNSTEYRTELKKIQDNKPTKYNSKKILIDQILKNEILGILPISTEEKTRRDNQKDLMNSSKIKELMHHDDKNWLNCEIYRKYSMYYELHINNCKIPNISSPYYINRSFLLLSPLFELIKLFFNFREDINGKITSMHNLPNYVLYDKQINTEIEVLDLFIYTNNIKLLFDIISNIVYNKKGTLSENLIYKIVQVRIKSVKILKVFFDNEDNIKYRNNICRILLLLRESAQGIKSYDTSDDAFHLPFYIIGDYILHRIKNINYTFDKINLFNAFCIVGTPKPNTKSPITELIDSYIYMNMMNSIDVVYTLLDGKLSKPYKNCVEITIFNLFKLLYYNKETDKINTEKFNESCDNKIKNFFNQYTLTNIQDNLVHILSEWGQLMANRRGIVYEQKYLNESWEVNGISITDLFKQLIYSNKPSEIQVKDTDDKSIANVRQNMWNLLVILVPSISIHYDDYDIIINDMYKLIIHSDHCELIELPKLKINKIDSHFYDIIMSDRIHATSYILRPYIIINIPEISNEMVHKILNISNMLNIPNETNRGIYNMPNIINLELEGDVKTIGNNAFLRLNSKIKELTISSDSILNSIGDYAFYNTDIRTVKLPNSVVEIGEYAFANNNKLIVFNIPDKLKIIQTATFKDCTNLREINIDKGSELVKIGNYAFYDTNITTINIPNIVVEIGEYAFANTKLILFNIPDKLKIIQTATFKDCTNLSEINIDNGSELLKIGNYAFYNISIKTINIPNSVVEIGIFAFYNCDSLIQININNDSKLTIIGDYGFGETSIKTINLPNCVSQIGKFAFTDCRMLQSFTIPDELTIICENTFENCEDLIEIKVGSDSKLSKIESGAFLNCNKLKSIYLPKTIRSIDSTSFNPGIELHIHKSSKNIIPPIYTNLIIIEDTESKIHETIQNGGRMYWKNKKKYLYLKRVSVI